MLMIIRNESFSQKFLTYSKFLKAPKGRYFILLHDVQTGEITRNNMYFHLHIQISILKYFYNYPKQLH